MLNYSKKVKSINFLKIIHFSTMWLHSSWGSWRPAGLGREAQAVDEQGTHLKGRDVCTWVRE